MFLLAWKLERSFLRSFLHFIFLVFTFLTVQHRVRALGLYESYIGGRGSFLKKRVLLLYYHLAKLAYDKAQ